MRWQYLVQRTLSQLITLLIIITIVFLLFRALPGNPADVLVTPDASPELRERMIEHLGLDRPLHIQYVLYLGDLLQGDLGRSYVYRQPVAGVLGYAFLNSLVLAVAIFAVSYTMGFVGGVLLAWARGTRREQAVTTVVLFFRGAPPFWTGMIAIVVFAIHLRWFPIGGMREPGTAGGALWQMYVSLDFLRHLLLPTLVGSLYALALPMLLMRGSMLEVMSDDYVDLARAKGVREVRVMFAHAARNALLPLIAASGLFIGWAIGAMTVLERVFNWPGLGRLIVEAASSRDYPLAQGAFISIGLLIMLMNLIVDLVVGYLDPRVRASQ